MASSLLRYYCPRSPKTWSANETEKRANRIEGLDVDALCDELSGISTDRCLTAFRLFQTLANVGESPPPGISETDAAYVPTSKKFGQQSIRSDSLASTRLNVTS